MCCFCFGVSLPSQGILLVLGGGHLASDPALFSRWLSASLSSAGKGGWAASLPPGIQPRLPSWGQVVPQVLSGPGECPRPLELPRLVGCPSSAESGCSCFRVLSLPLCSCGSSFRRPWAWSPRCLWGILLSSSASSCQASPAVTFLLKSHKADGSQTLATMSVITLCFRKGSGQGFSQPDLPPDTSTTAQPQVPAVGLTHACWSRRTSRGRGS